LDHPDTATSLVNVGSVLVSQERYAEAEPLFQRALEIREKAFGHDNVSTAGAETNLAWLYSEEGKISDAAPLYAHTLAVYEKLYGSEHRFITGALENVAFIRFAEGKTDECDQLLGRMMDIQRKQKREGEDSEATALLDKAGKFMDEKNYPMAKACYFSACSIFRNVRGPDDAAVQDCLGKIAEIYRAQGKKLLADYYAKRAAFGKGPPTSSI